MENKYSTYEKPQMTFQKIVLDDTVADTCWSPSNPMDLYAYLDTPGAGYVYFKATSSGDNCGKASVEIIAYIGYPDDKKPSTSDIEKYLKQYSGGNSGNPYKKGEHLKPEPGPEWS